MSSHHFVKEGQEPALLILSGSSFAQAEGLLEWAPLVIVAESALDDVLLWGIKIDIVLAEGNSTSYLADRLIDQAPIRILSGIDPVETALQYLTSIKHSAVSILASAFSDKMRKGIERMVSPIQVTVHVGECRWSFISSGSFRKWYQASARLAFSDRSLASLTTGLRAVNSHFEVIDDQWISVQSSGPFWIGEYL